MKIITRLNKKDKIGIILVTNILDDTKYAENVVVLNKGKIIFNDKKSKLNKKFWKGLVWMFRKMTFGQYTYKNSIIHKLDPRIKIIAVVALSSAAFLMNSYYKFTIFSSFILLVIILSKINFSALIRNLRPFF